MCVFVTSPFPPVRTARIVESPNPEVVKIRPSPITTEGTTPSPGLETVQILSPVLRSKPCTTLPAELTSWSRPFSLRTCGVICAIREDPRRPLHRTSPVFLSRASIRAWSHGFCHPSFLSGPLLLPSKGTISKSLYSIGETPSPCSLKYSNSRWLQITLPSVETAARVPSKARTYTLLPSVTGVDEAYEFSLCLCPGFCRSTCLFQRTVPVSRSRHNKRNEAPPSVAVVTNTRSSNTIGDDQPSPGIGFFQTMLDVWLHSSGTSFSFDIPCRVGPRKQGQFSARVVLNAISAKVTEHDMQKNLFR